MSCWDAVKDDEIIPCFSKNKQGNEEDIMLDKLLHMQSILRKAISLYRQSQFCICDDENELEGMINYPSNDINMFNFYFEKIVKNTFEDCLANIVNSIEKLSVDMEIPLSKFKELRYKYDKLHEKKKG